MITQLMGNLMLIVSVSLIVANIIIIVTIVVTIIVVIVMYSFDDHITFIYSYDLGRIIIINMMNIGFIITPGSKYMAQTYFFRGGCAIYLTVIFFKDMYPKQQKCPEDGATLHVQNGPNCAIYPIFNLNPFFRDRTFRSSKR